MPVVEAEEPSGFVAHRCRVPPGTWAALSALLPRMRPLGLHHAAVHLAAWRDVEDMLVAAGMVRYRSGLRANAQPRRGRSDGSNRGEP